MKLDVLRSWNYFGVNPCAEFLTQADVTLAVAGAGYFGFALLRLLSTTLLN